MMRTHVTLPRLVTEGHIDILVDTGAQVTCILGADASILWEADDQGRTFLDFFQTDQQAIPKGIIAIDLRTLP